MDADSPWRPRRWNDRLAGCLWLGRTVDKGRRLLASEAAGADLLDGYQFGVHNPTDAILLGRLGLGDAKVLEILRRNPDDETAAAEILALAGWDARRIEAWNRWFGFIWAPTLAMLDADEGYLAGGPGTSMLRILLRYVIYPPVAVYYRVRKGGARR